MRRLDLEGDSRSSYEISKFLVLGDAQSGKTSLMRSYTEGASLKKRPKETVGCELHIKCPRDRGNSYGKRRVYEFWEVSGELKYRQFIKVYTLPNLREFSGIIFIFELINLKTLQKFKEQIKNTYENYFTSCNEESESFKPRKVPILFIGNKIDLLDDTVLNTKKKQAERWIFDIFSNKKRNEHQDNYSIMYTSVVNGNVDFSLLDTFIEHAIANRFENLYCVDNSIDLENSSYRSYANDKISSISDFFSGLVGVIKRGCRVFKRKSKEKREEETKKQKMLDLV